MSIRTATWMPALTAGLLAANAAFGAALDETESADLYGEAKQFFREANAKADEDPEAARALYRKAAMRFERIVTEGDVHNGRLFYNIGNTYFRMKDIGRAILNYRRAEQYIPNDPNLIQNLRYARARRADRFDEPQTAKVLETLFFWHYDLSTRARTLTFGVCFAAFWVLCAVRLFLKRTWVHTGIVLSGLLWCALLVSLVAETVHRRRVRPGVVIAEQVTARKGDSETYQPSFTEPLHAGTEFRLVEARKDWYQVELPDGRRCWVPSDAAELVR